MKASTSPFKSPGLRKLSNTFQMQQQPCRHPRCLKRRGSLWLYSCTNVSPVRHVGHRDSWGSCAPVPFLHPSTENTTQPLLRAFSAHGRSFCCLNLFILLSGYNICGLGWVPTPCRAPTLLGAHCGWVMCRLFLTMTASCPWSCSSSGGEIRFSSGASHSSVKWGTKHRWLNYLNSLVPDSSGMYTLTYTFTKLPTMTLHFQRLTNYGKGCELHLPFSRDDYVYPLIS